MELKIETSIDNRINNQQEILLPKKKKTKNLKLS